MHEWLISAPGLGPVPAHQLAGETCRPLSRPAARPGTYLLAGTCQARLAACAETALAAGHRIVLLPPNPRIGALATPGGILAEITASGTRMAAAAGTGVRGGWDAAMFTSGSTTGAPRGYGFTAAQLTTVTGWYETIYQVTRDSIIVTTLPAAYNFTFIAGVLLAARTGARLHFSQSPAHLLSDAAELARHCDRLVILANPVLLDQANLPARLPANILADSGGAPLSTTAITAYREHGLDLREGYGLTETASLTHFDTGRGARPPGTVGCALPGVTAAITPRDSKPVITVTSPATGIPLSSAEPAPPITLVTTDLGTHATDGRLRLLGRADDDQIGGLWPRDTLDAVGPLLGRRCALIRHQHGRARIHLLSPPQGSLRDDLTRNASQFLDVPPEHVSITWQGSTPLLSSAKLPRRQAGFPG